MLTSTGYANKTLADILAEQRTAFETTIDPYVNLLPEEILGQIRDIMSQGIKNAYDLAESVYGQTGLTATGINLDIVGLLVGKIRLLATKARINNYLVTTDADAVTIPKGTIFRSSVDSTKQFETIEDNVCATIGSYRINLIAVDAGLTDVSTDEIDVIQTPVSGLDTGTNDVSSSFINGRDLETDDEFRLRIFLSPVIARTLRVDAIANAVLDINNNADNEGYTPVSQVKVIQNVESITINGMPRNSVQVVAYYPGVADAVTDTKICTAIMGSIADGIKTVTTADESYTETIQVGNSEREITFSRPDEIKPYVTVNTVPALSAGQKTNLENDISDYLETFQIGQTLRAYGKDSISDIVNNFADVDITDYDIFIGLSSSPSTDDPLTATDFEIFIYNSARVIIGDK